MGGGRQISRLERVDDLDRAHPGQGAVTNSPLLASVGCSGAHYSFSVLGGC